MSKKTENGSPSPTKSRKTTSRSNPFKNVFQKKGDKDEDEVNKKHKEETSLREMGFSKNSMFYLSSRRTRRNGVGIEAKNESNESFVKDSESVPETFAPDVVVTSHDPLQQIPVETDDSAAVDSRTVLQRRASGPLMTKYRSGGSSEDEAADDDEDDVDGEANEYTDAHPHSPTLGEAHPMQETIDGRSKRVIKPWFASRRPGTDKRNFTVQYVRVHGIADRAYKNESEPRGLIFMKNFETFDRDYDPRCGSVKDYDNLLYLFSQMGYQKHCKCETGNISKSKFLNDLEAFRKIDHERFDSAVIIIMSHGVRDKTFLTSDNEEVDLMDVYSTLNNTNCAVLKNKPKIFILQFCRPRNNTLVPSPSMASLSVTPNWSSSIVEEIVQRRLNGRMEELEKKLRSEFQQLLMASASTGCLEVGSSCTGAQAGAALSPTDVDNAPDEKKEAPQKKISMGESTAFRYQGVHTLEVDAAPQRDRASSVVEDAVPDYSDMYSIFATNSGGVAYRDPRKGSLFVQAICQVFSKHAYQDDIEELVRKVSQHMQKQLSREDPFSCSKTAVVERVNNGLDKSFYFNPFQMKRFNRGQTIA